MRKGLVSSISHLREFAWLQKKGRYIEVALLNKYGRLFLQDVLLREDWEKYVIDKNFINALKVCGNSYIDFLECSIDEDTLTATKSFEGKGEFVVFIINLEKYYDTVSN